ncbi:NAD-reducing hydrogenase HoxS subunit delta [Aquisphaera giovannonii]|uniref:NAD-reducing hydrogenase HoxS subunit delta n=1 Tax=Aquisphaera giovannonii TaxID=406548 RepID=A0A5B9WA64_9BACT|nr:oxidoreductase [Aquisphaera giovannonii]QEH36985.1 NAD-reducing hydrogenase HoxS subunit delta [Aquisphaera giovannonii]
MERLKLATMWLGGCSGCHMSFLDLDEFLIELAGMAEIVYSPIVDAKVFPEHVDATLVEGAVANEDHLGLVRNARARSDFLVAFGDCAITGNVTAIRNPLGGARVVLDRSYLCRADLRPAVPESPGVLPRLLDRVVPVHAVVPVDAFLPGCPPPAGRIRETLSQLATRHAARLAGADLKFG